MGQKVNPIGFRIGINRTRDSRWFADDRYAALLHEDIKLRNHLFGKLSQAGVSRIVIENNQFQSTLIRDLVDTTHLPVVGRKTDVDKVTRARSVAARYEARKIFHHSSLAGSPFEMELLSFPKGHDDMIDALGSAMDLGRAGLTFGALRQ